jgi:hypothetical protein
MPGKPTPPHDSLWRAPQPLWGDAPGAAPTLLRFASDDFMERLTALLERPSDQSPDTVRGAALAKLVARPETWRDGLPETPAAARPSPLTLRLAARLTGRKHRPAAITTPAVATTLPATTALPLKLYQSAHQRYYLVTASLVCQRPGLPDRELDAGRQEAARFVLRRLLPPAEGCAWAEHAFVNGAWRRLDDASALAADEEELPLFPLGYRLEDDRPRRLLAGLVPVGRREQYLGAPEAPPAQTSAPYAAPLDDPRLAIFQRAVTGPWRQLLEQAWDHALTKEPDPQYQSDTAARDGARRALRETQQVGTWLVLLGLAEFLNGELPEVWTALHGGAATGLSPAQTQLLQALQAATLNNALRDDLQTSVGKALNPASGDPAQLARDTFAFPATLAAAAGRALTDQTVLLAAGGTVAIQAGGSPAFGWLTRAGWPSWLFPLADGVLPDQAPLPLRPAERTPEVLALDARTRQLLALDRLEALLLAALPEPAVERAPIPTPGPGLAPEAEDWFVIRCVLRMPWCEDRQAALLSAPTAAFRMASFFDPDAPARPIRIGLPMDISPAGLARCDKNTAFVMGDLLCGQMKRAKGMGLGDLIRSVLPFPLHKDLDPGGTQLCSADGGNRLGMICTLSIPIITICALILLFMVVLVLDFVFRWLPWFVMCFPIFKKNGSGS